MASELQNRIVGNIAPSLIWAVLLTVLGVLLGSIVAIIANAMPQFFANVTFALTIGFALTLAVLLWATAVVRAYVADFIPKSIVDVEDLTTFSA